MSRVSLDVNGRTLVADVEPDSPLLYVLRDSLGLNNPRFGCGLGQCGACTVLVNGAAIRSCTLPVSSVAGKKIVTLEGLGTPEHPHPVQQAFVEEQALQCGYCVNGWLLAAVALLDKNPSPTEPQIHQALDGLICRCGSHASMLAAVRRAVMTTKKGVLA
jgi:nicotinate dehydrogenase subunit A